MVGIMGAPQLKITFQAEGLSAHETTPRLGRDPSIYKGHSSWQSNGSAST